MSIASRKKKGIKNKRDAVECTSSRALKKDEEISNWPIGYA